MRHISKAWTNKKNGLRFKEKIRILWVLDIFLHSLKNQVFEYKAMQATLIHGIGGFINYV